MTRGFTLLEVLIALAITALALAAGLQAVRQGASREAQIEQKTLAEWALDNAANELQLAGQPPVGDNAPRQETLLGHAFATRVLTTDIPGAIRLETIDATQPGQILATRTLHWRVPDAR